MILLIPAYQPDERLPTLVAAVRAADPTVRVLVVDDGSTGEGAAAALAAATRAGAEVIGHQPNRGKGFSLKVGFGHIAVAHPGQPVVTADCDGQHRPDDILAVAAELDARPAALVLGTRRFAGPVPLRSRLGNTVTRWLFAAAARSVVHDTQTGLRGLSPDLLPWAIAIPGDRFDYELTMLLQAARGGVDVREVPIDTVYLDHNASSHFRPLVDSVRVLLPLVRFTASALAAFLVDTLALLLLAAVTGSIPMAATGARAISSSMNFFANRHLVFVDRARRPLRTDAVQYWALVVVILLANILMLLTLSALGVALLPAKVITDVVLFIASFRIQRRIVFARPSTAPSIPSPLERP